MPAGCWVSYRPPYAGRQDDTINQNSEWPTKFVSEYAIIILKIGSLVWQKARTRKDVLRSGGESTTLSLQT